MREKKEQIEKGCMVIDRGGTQGYKTAIDDNNRWNVWQRKYKWYTAYVLIVTWNIRLWHNIYTTEREKEVNKRIRREKYWLL